jgi:hypothetical protein
MNPLATQLITHDRGLGTAYERYCFYQLVDRWAREYDVATMLEGPVDGMAGVAGVHGVGLARRGIKVVAAVTTEEKARVARAVYERGMTGQSPASGDWRGANVDVRVVADPMRASELAPADLVIAYHALPLVDDWRAYLAVVAKLAKKAFVVTVCNPHNWGVSAIQFVGRLRGIRGLDPPDVWKTETLAPALWELGRVREHVYFDAPWWPDLQVSAGQSLADRARQLFRQKKRDVAFTAGEEGAALAERFVYGAERWPYFGGEGWTDELMPALLRHPGFDGTKAKWGKRVAHLHGFVVDTRPRTPQARRRLAQVGESRGG